MYDILKTQAEDSNTSASILSKSNLQAKFFVTEDMHINNKSPFARISTIIMDDDEITTKFDNPEQLLRLIELIEEKNHFAIQNAQEAREEYDKVRKAKEDELKKVEEKYLGSCDQLVDLERKLNYEKDKNRKLLSRQQLLDNKTEIKLNENEVFTVDVVQAKIIEMVKGLKKGADSEDFSQAAGATEDILIQHLKVLSY